MSLRRRVMLINSLVLATIFGLTFVLAIATQRHSLRATKDRELTNIANITTSAIQDRELVASGAAEIISDQSWLAQAMRAGDRAALLHGTQRMFERMRSIYGASILQFFTPPAEALLFVENPSMPIKDFRSTRQMIVSATVHGVSQRGLELGPAGLAVRGVVPVKDDSSLIGVVEYAGDFQELLKHISTLSDSQLAAFINEDLWEKARQNDVEYIPARDELLDGKRAAYSTDWSLTSNAITPDVIAPTSDMRTTYRTINGTEYGILTMPLMDYSGRQIGFIVSVRNFSNLNTTFVNEMLFTAMRLLSGFILTLGAVTIVFNSLLLRPINDLNEKLRDLAGGKTDTPVAGHGRMDEVGDLYEVAEKIRRKLRSASGVPSGDL
ncbi:cache domain-containing protein [Tunturiibacter psychrotolerans]|uniref:cache domain-containing protein n=1 Tax=Tunturiibacter psychrotolerans TaxID=3069686 RepID=UPI003D244671